MAGTTILPRLHKGVKQVFHVDVTQGAPRNTGLNFRPGAQIHIVSDGTAKYDPSVEAFGPSGCIGMHRANTPAPNENIGALLVKTGSIYTPLSGGRLDWQPPTDDNLELVYNDTWNGYANNFGSFDVTIEYDQADLMS